MSTGTEQQSRMRSLTLANQRRMKVAAVRRALRSGALSLAEVMLDPPDALRGMLVIDVIRLRHSVANTRGATRIGTLALRDRVNLMVRLGDASCRTRAWVAEHGSGTCHAPETERAS